MLKYSFALCVDPETSQYYSINLSNYAINIEQCSNQNLYREFQEKAQNACAELKQIISWEAFDYGVSKQTDFYRRRRLPEYLLQDTKLKFPSYIVQQVLPRAITIQTTIDQVTGQKKQTEKYQIDAQIYLTEYADVIRSKQPFASDSYRPIPKVFTCILRLPNPVNEVIKVIIKMAFQKESIELTTRQPDNQFVLKVFGSQYYLYGNTTFMKYQYVRKCLRNKQPAKLQLTEKKFKDSSKFRPFVFQRSRKDVEQGLYKEVPWNNLRNQQPFLWYPPQKLDQKYMKDLKQKKQLQRLYREQKNNCKQKLKQNTFYKSYQLQKLRNQLDKYIQQQKFQIPRLILKQHMIKKTQERRLYAFNKIVQINNKFIFSGQCEFGLDIKILGITRFNNVLKHNQYPKIFTEQRGNFINLKRLSLVLSVKFTYGDQVLQWQKFSPLIITDNIPLNYKISWKKLSSLPLESKLFFEMIAFSPDKKQAIQIGCAAFNMFDQKGNLLMGLQKTNIWPFLKPDLRIAGCISSYQRGYGLPESAYSQMVIQFPKFEKPVRWSLRNSQVLYNFGYNNIDVSVSTDNPKIQQISQLQTLLAMDPIRMTHYDEQQKRILKICHNNYCKNPQKYMNFLYSINWVDPNEVRKALDSRQILNKQKEEGSKSSNYIGVFASRFVDEAIRLHAVDKLISVPDDEILLYIPQLVQSLLTEAVHHNSLSQFLLERAVLSPFTIGQTLFWQLRSQLHKKFEFQRYAVYLECLAMCSVIRKSFVSQIQTNNVLAQVSQRVIYFKDATTEGKDQYFKTKEIPEMRNRLSVPFLLAINPQKQNDDFLQSQCKVFSSKKKPLLLTLVQNPARRKSNLTDSPKKKPAPVVLQRVIFKTGDDIHQDQLTLQILKIMDNIWLQKGYDLKMSIYRVLPVADMMGFIEVVGNAESCSSIHFENDTSGAMDEKTYDLYLLKHNQTRESYVTAVQNFIRSTAGYLVASYILGLGDRHSGNVMITKSGMFFHIDFGHFLGNFKSKFGINRQRSPFLFTSLFKYVIQKNKSWDYFIKLCGQAFNQIRKNANFIIQMFMLMTAAGIPQLYNQSNIKYLVDKLRLELSQAQAAELISKQIDDSLKFGVELYKKFDNYIHDKKHNK